MSGINSLFVSALNWIYSWVGNYGWSVVIFTMLIRLLVLPLELKSRKGMRATQRVQPQVAALQKKYANDKDKLNQKMMELYKKENVSPMAGCLPLLLTMPILFIMFTALIAVAWGVFHRAELAAASILMWGAGDAAAALIGIPFGRHKLLGKNHGKVPWLCW